MLSFCCQLPNKSILSFQNIYAMIELAKANSIIAYKGSEHNYGTGFSYYPDFKLHIFRFSCIYPMRQHKKSGL